MTESGKMAHYRLSSAAGRDFAQIFDYGIDEYGLKRATDYQNKLKQRFSELAETPLLYPAIDHIRAGYRRSVCGVHSIYYRIEGDTVKIVRVLGRQNSEKAF